MGPKVKKANPTHHDTRVRLRSIGRNRSKQVRRRRRRAGAGDSNLRALGVELRRVRLVEGQQLVADEVVPGLQAFRDPRRPLQVLVDDGGAPVVAVEHVAGQAHLVDLEPLLRLPVAGGEGAVAGVQPHHHGPLLVRPLLPDGGHVGPRRDLGGDGRGGPAVAGHQGVGHRHDRVVVFPLPLDRLRAGDGREALVPLVRFAADLVAGHGAVGGGEGGGEEEEGEERGEHVGWG